MGLDMYLYAEKYVSRSDEEYKAVLTTLDTPVPFGADGFTGLSVKLTALYWRKSNQIHAWFVKNVQAGKDDCGDYYVSHAQLDDLRITCLRVLATAETTSRVEVYDQHVDGVGLVPLERTVRTIKNPRALEDLLPSRHGVFFGSTDYDEWYLQDIELTIKLIDRALALPDDWDLKYGSSW